MKGGVPWIGLRDILPLDRLGVAKDHPPVRGDLSHGKAHSRDRAQGSLHIALPECPDARWLRGGDIGPEVISKVGNVFEEDHVRENLAGPRPCG